MTKTRDQIVTQVRLHYPDLDATQAADIFDSVHRQIVSVLELNITATDVRLYGGGSGVGDAPYRYNTSNKAENDTSVRPYFYKGDGAFTTEWTYGTNYEIGKVWSVEWKHTVSGNVVSRKLQRTTFQHLDKETPNWRGEPIVANTEPNYYIQTSDINGLPTFIFHPKPGFNSNDGSYSTYIRIWFSNVIPLASGSATIAKALLTEWVYVYGICYRYSLRRDKANSQYWGQLWRQELDLCMNAMYGRSIEAGMNFPEAFPKSRES